MPAPQASSARFVSIAIVVALALFAVRFMEQQYVKQAVEDAETRGLYEVKRDRQSPTGYAAGQRRQILSPDGCHWVMQTQQMLSTGEWRVRHVDYENAPAGRDVHWSSSLRWWLATLAAIASVANHDSVVANVERVAPYASPTLFLCLFALFVPAVWRWFGTRSAAVFALGMVLLAPVSDLFLMGDPDHHGLVIACCLATVLLLVAGGSGWVNDSAAKTRPSARWRDLAMARRYFVASGAIGATGLWISSVTEIPVLLALGGGCLVAMASMRRDAALASADVRLAPELWRWWGISGAAASAAWYLIEYFPAHMGLRLEVNHPVYALAWWGGGELLARLWRWRVVGTRQAEKWSGTVLGGAVLAVALPPVLLLTTRDRTFWIFERMLWTLHVDLVVELGSVARRLHDVPVRDWLAVFNPLPFVAGAAGWRAWRQTRDVACRTGLALTLVPAVLVTVFTVLQVRWIGLATGLWLVALVVALAQRSSSAPAFTRAGKIAFAVGAFASCWPWLAVTGVIGGAMLRGEPGLAPLDLRLAILRDVAQWLRVRVGTADAVVLAEPSAATALIYHGGFRTIGTLYWENKDGLHAMTDLFNATDDVVGRDLARRRGITHVVVVPWDTYATGAAQLDGSAASVRQRPGLVTRLALGRDVPAWLRPVYYPTSRIERLNEGNVLVYEVVSEMSPAEAELRAAQLTLENGDAAVAASRLSALVHREPELLAAWIALARARFELRQLPELQAAFDGIGAQMAHARRLELGDRIYLADLLAKAVGFDAAREQIRECIAAADAAGLRRLPPGALEAFVRLAHESGEATHRPEIVRFAEGILPRYLAASPPGSAPAR